MEGLFRGIWYKSNVRIEGEYIYPVLPFDSYNPFEWYFAAKTFRQEKNKKKSLYLKFLSVDSGKPEEIAEFCQGFGLLGNLDIPSHIARAKEIANFSKEAKYSLEETRRLEATRISRPGFPGKIHLNPERFEFDLDIIRFPMKIMEFRKAQEKLRSALTYAKNGSPSLTERSTLDPHLRFINHTLQDCRVNPQLSWNVQEHQWEILWRSLTLTGYFALMFMLDLVGPGRFLSCPKCNKVFMTASNRVKFCSDVCQGIFKVQKYQRKKKAEELISQKRKAKKGSQSAGKKK